MHSLTKGLSLRLHCVSAGSDCLPAGRKARSGEPEERPGETNQDAGVRPQAREVSKHTHTHMHAVDSKCNINGDHNTQLLWQNRGYKWYLYIYIMHYFTGSIKNNDNTHIFIS